MGFRGKEGSELLMNVMRLNVQARQVEDAACIADQHGETALADALYSFADVLLDKRRRLERGV